MSQLMPERLYALLPAFHRVRDAEQGEPLRTLLGVIETELERVETDIAGLYENWFIETCDEWVVPYLGDLLGVRPIRPIDSAGVSTRAYVANTIAYRRRKGTALVLEQLANDVTGWPAHVVESFKRLTTTQHVNHIRPLPTATPSLRDAAAAEWADGAFDPFSHTADMRSAARGGRHAINHVALYLWRLRSYRLGGGDPGDEAADFVSARRDGTVGWRVHPVGCDAPLFNIPRTETAITQASAEEDVPGPLRALALHADADRLRRGVNTSPLLFLTDDASVLRVFVRLAGNPAPMEVPRDAMYACRLPRPRPGTPVPALAMALDPQRGRIAFPEGLPVDEVWTQYSYGFAGDLGGGPYDRTASVRNIGVALAGSAAAVGERVFDAPDVWQVGVSHLLADDGRGTLFPSLRDAVAAWNAEGAGRTGVIVIMDSLSEHDVPGAPALPLEVRVGERSRLLIVAGGWPREPVVGDVEGGSAVGAGAGGAGDGVGPSVAADGSLARRAGTFDASGVRAHVIADVVVRGTAPEGASDGGACVFNGVLLEGRLDVAAGNLGQLVLSHCTVAAGAGAGASGNAAPAGAGAAAAATAEADASDAVAALVVHPGGNAQLAVRVERSICPAVVVTDPIRTVTIVDSLIGGSASSGSMAAFASTSASASASASASGSISAPTPASTFDSLPASSSASAARFGLSAPRTAVTLLRSTFFRPVDVQSLSASDCIFAEGVQAARRQTGCVRFSYVPAGSAVPRRYRCQPDTEIAARLAALRVAPALASGPLATEPSAAEPSAAVLAAVRAEVRASLRPLFVSREYGDPGFGQLESRCAIPLRTGAESGAEMGAFEFLHQPQREANLRGVLDEYLRFGLEASLTFVT